MVQAYAKVQTSFTLYTVKEFVKKRIQLRAGNEQLLTVRNASSTCYIMLYYALLYSMVSEINVVACNFPESICTDLWVVQFQFQNLYKMGTTDFCDVTK